MAGMVNDEFQFDTAMPFHRKEWAVKRVAWGLFTLLLLAALGGVLGPGPLSRQTLSSQEAGLQVEFERFLRKRRSAELRIRVAEPAGESLQLHFGQDLARSAAIERIIPEPDSVTTAADQLIHRFSVRGSAAEVKIEFEPSRTGPLEFGLARPNKKPLSIRTFVYP